MSRPRAVAAPVFRACLVLVMIATAGGLTSATAAASQPAPAQCQSDPTMPKRQFRAMWIASVSNLDWPSRTGLSVAAQQAEFRAWLDLAEQYRMNAVVVQVRPTADAFWPSPHEPWSHWLTGTQGSNPGYDPLGFMVAEAHARDLEFHAWFNPYRVATHNDPSRLHTSHPARQNPGWVFGYDGQLVYNPGVPAVRTHVTNAIMHAVTNYDIDAVHWDDYFYPYPASGQSIPDQATYAQYGGGFSSVEDWRRNNVDLLVQQMNQRIKQAKPWVKFGISPFGIWRNQSTDPRGSATSGLQSYDAVYADSRRWVTEQWVDYIVPQVYWHIGFAAADYAVLVPWWSSVVSGTRVQLYVGQATYKVGADPGWQNAAELTNHLHLNRNHPPVRGDVFFRAGNVSADRLGAMSRLRTDHYSRPALVPVAGHLGGSAPPAPSITSATRTAAGVQLAWQPGGSSSSPSPTSYAIYRLDGSAPPEACAFDDARHLLATTRGRSFTDTTAASGATYTYVVTALERRHHESARSAGRVVTGGGGGGFSTIVDNTTPGRFTASANWGTSSWSPQRHGADYRYAEPVAASDPAWFRAELPAAGSYRVEVWYPADAGYNSQTPHVVVTTGGNQTVNVDQRTGGGRWVSLGTFPLAAGDRNVVGVSRWTSTTGYVVADAVRITRA